MFRSSAGSLGTDVSSLFVAVVINSVIATMSAVSAVSAVSVVSVVSLVSAVRLFRAGGETNSAACETVVSLGVGHNHRATDDGVSAGQVHISGNVNLTLSGGSECAWSLLVVLFGVVASGAILTNEWVPDLAGRVAAISQVAKSANH